MSLSQTDAQAQVALRTRQGSGARLDAKNAPHEDLLVARRGTAFFSRQLQFLTDGQLDGLARDSEVSRRQIVAEVSYHARYLARAMEDFVATPSILKPADFKMEVARAVTLPARALRSLFHHSEVHLNVVWRDLSNEDWAKEIPNFKSVDTTLPNLVKARADIVWGAATDIAPQYNPSEVPMFLDANWLGHIPRN
ncbi:MAG: maleylpyruvate isomerase [Pseudomonadota bacterium]